jgi:PRTRC genetic system protein E
MKTNFFEQIAGLQINGNLLLNIHQDETGVLAVSAILKKGNITATASNNLPPMLFKGTAQELDEGFFAQLSQPVKQTVGLINNLEAYQKELEKARKNTKTDKDKSVKNTSENEDDTEDYNNLFSPIVDYMEAKA